MTACGLKSLIITFPKEQPAALPELQNYQPHQSFKVMLKEIIAEEQAYIRWRRPN